MRSAVPREPRSLAAAVSLIAALAGCEATPSAALDAGDAWRDADRPDGIDAGCTAVDFVEALADPLAPARRLPGRVALVSSRSPEPAIGMHNDDFAHFVGTDGPRVILADEVGPGVITRLWLTYGPPAVGSIVDVPMRLTIDGHDIPLDGALDARLGDLADGTSPTFPAPWAMDPSVASGGLVLATPLQYQESARVELTVQDGAWAYYQVDVRRLPSDACVRSFDGTWTPAQRQALDDAATIWRSHEHPGDDHTVPTRSLAPGESTELTLDGPGAITTLEVLSAEADRGTLALRIAIDGEMAADAPLAWITASAFPAGTYQAALSASSPTSAISYAPMPFETSARVAVVNTGTAPASVGLRVRAMAMDAIPSDVGRFHAECGATETSIPIHVCLPPYDDQFPNVVLGQTSRGPGQLAGITTFQTSPDPWWIALEPDHEVAIDGQYDMLGTGTEDYFGGAFYFQNGPYASMLSGASGFTRPTGTETPIPDAHTHLYRYHLVDGMPFEQDLRFELESYVDGVGYQSCLLVYTFPGGT